MHTWFVAKSVRVAEWSTPELVQARSPGGSELKLWKNARGAVSAPMLVLLGLWAYTEKVQVKRGWLQWTMAINLLFIIEV